MKIESQRRLLLLGCPDVTMAGGEALIAAVIVAVHGVERRDNHVVDSDDPHLRGVICCFHNCSF